MLYLGNKEVTAAYIGGKAVSDAYLNDKHIIVTPSLNSIENSLAREYLNNTNYTDDPNYTYSTIESYSDRTASYIKDYPHPYYINFPAQNTDSVLVVSDGSDTYQLPVTANSERYPLYNLLPYTDYTWELYNGGNIVASGSAHQGGYMRMIYIDGVRNIRDLGGWNCNGGTVKYGKIYRGTALVDGYGNMTQAGLHMAKDVLKISTELDLDESTGAAWVGIDYYHYEITAYETGLANTQSNIANSLHALISEIADNGIVYIHCAAGCDRTATIVLLIEALLGVSDSDKSKDYELSSFYMSYFDSERLRTSSPNGYKSMVQFFDSYNGLSLNERITNYCLAIGITQTEINTLRSAMIESE